MKRLVVTGPRQVEFEDVPIPECPRDGILAKAIVTAISTGTEIRVFRWIPVDDEGTMLHGGMPFPDGPTENGYSMVAEIVEVGADVEGLSVGERVFLGETHKEYAAVRASDVLKLPDSIPTEQAVMLNLLGVAHIALRTGEPAPGENVAVVGLGVIGQSAVAWCRAFGFRTVGIDVDGGRLEVARAMGADAVASPADDEFRSRVDDVFDGEGADMVIEAASTWKAIRTSMDISRQGGRVVVIARHTDRPDYNPVGHPYLSQRITLKMAYGYEDPGQRWDRDRCVRLTLDMLSRGELAIEPMITHRVPWHQLPEMYHRLDQGDLSILGVVVDWT